MADADELFQRLSHLDLAFWLQVRTYAETSKKPAFGLCRDALKHLARADNAKVSLLANTAMLSWKLGADPAELAETILSAERIVEQDPAAAALHTLSNSTPTSALVYEFLTLARKISLRCDDSIAQLALGVPQTLLSQIRHAPRLALQLTSLHVAWNISLRFPSRVLVELLQREHSEHYKLCAVQAAIADTSINAGHPDRTEQRKAEIRTQLRQLTAPEVACNDDSTTQQRQKPAQQQRLCHTDPLYKLVVDLMRAGFSRDVVRLEAGSEIGDKVLLRIRREQEQAGIELPKTAYRLQTGSALTSYPRLIQASILMLTYQKLAGHGLKSSVDAEALMRALAFFERIKAFAGILNTYRWPPIVPSLAYGLAMEMRGGTDSGELAYLSRCSTCASIFFTSTRQVGAASSKPCAFCRVSDAEKINAA